MRLLLIMSLALAAAAAWIAPREECAAWWIRTVATLRERTVGDLADEAVEAWTLARRAL